MEISTFLKDNYNWCQKCQVPCHFFGAKTGTATFTKYLFEEKMAHSQQILNKKILKFEDLETRFKHVEKI